jgi:hypothetical protein
VATCSAPSTSEPAEEAIAMDEKKNLWTANDIEERARPFTQRLNPNSYFLRTPLNDPAKPFGPA